MNVEPSTVVTVLVFVGGIAGTWGAFSYRIRQLEIDAAEHKAAREMVAAVDDKVEKLRVSQGERLGVVEDDTKSLIGKFEGFQAGFGAGRRSRTSAHGHPIEKGGARAPITNDTGDAGG